MDAPGKVTLIALLVIGSALMLLGMLMPRIAPMWTIQNSPFVGQVVAALASQGPSKGVSMSDPDCSNEATRWGALEFRIDRGDFDGSEHKLELLSKHDRDKVVRAWADILLHVLHTRAARPAGVRPQ